MVFFYVYEKSVFFGIVGENNLWELSGTPLSLIILYLIIEQYTLFSM